jgi:hypothetical protein
MIDMAGTVVVEAQYDEPTFFDRGNNWVKRDVSWCPIDRSGRQIRSLQCQASDPTNKPSPPPYFCFSMPSLVERLLGRGAQ